MTFQEAKERLADIAKGEYYLLRYELIQHSVDCGGGMKAQCVVYIHGFNHISGPDWESALRDMDRAVNKCDPDPSEAPDYKPELG